MKIINTEKYFIGSWIQTASTISAELMANCGFDFLVVDTEHSAVDLSQAQAIFQAIKSGNTDCKPFVRLKGNDYATTKRYMDAGANGVIVPLVNSAGVAKEVVRAVKYPPDGDRGVGFCRDNMWGINLDSRIQSANQETFVCLQIEHQKALASIDEILSVKGVDAAFIGPYDLSASMGITAQFDHPDYQTAVATILNACNKYNVMAGIHVVQPDVDEVLQRIDQGFRMIGFSLDVTMISHISIIGLKKIRRKLNEK